MQSIDGVEKPLVCPIEATVEIDPVASNFHFNPSPFSPGPTGYHANGGLIKDMDIISINIQSMSRTKIWLIL